MANKALSKRQKLTIHVEPSQKALKPRNPNVPSATQRVSTGHRKGAFSPPPLHQRLLKKIVDEADDT